MRNLNTTIALTTIKVFTSVDVSFKNYLTAGGVDGLNHLWFMKAILLCYCVTPLLQYLKKYIQWVLPLIAICGVLRYIFIAQPIALFSWLWLYSVGYFYASIKSNWGGHVVLLTSTIIFVILCVCKSTGVFYSKQTALAWHDIGGISLCLGGIFLLNRLRISNLPYIIRFLDKNSFYIYITHHIFLLGPLSVVPLVRNSMVCIMLIFVLIVISTMILAQISHFCIQKLTPILLNNNS